MERKLSIYNSLLSVKDLHTIIFNSFTMESILIKGCKLNNWEDVLRKADGDQTLYKQLLETGMLVSKERDEVSELKLRINSGRDNNDNFILHINPTLDCNFNCWYCYEKHVPKSIMSIGVLNGVKNKISNILKSPNIQHIDVSFFGGEPLMHFKEIAKEIISHTSYECKNYLKSFRISFTTNGYLLNDSIIDWLSGFPCSFQITLDGGEASHNQTRFLKGGVGSYNKIVENIHKLVYKRLHVIVRVNYTTKNIDSVEGIFDLFNDLLKSHSEYISFDFQRVWQERRNEADETETKITKVRSLFREYGGAVHDNFLLQDARFPCYGDKKNYLLVNYNGDVFKCTARDFVSENRVGILRESGEIEYDHALLNARDNSKFSKKICHSCRIAPLCGGSCIQKSYELRDIDGCTLGYSEEDKDNVVLNILDWTISNKINSNKKIFVYE